jgi:hypothetical protein
LISVKSLTTWLTVEAALIVRYNLPNIPLNWEAFSIGAIGAVEIPGCYIEARNRKARLRESPFLYLYFANKYRIINKP